ncbi:alpha/beta hydrolase [uncultured Flavobacterium sp.]|uniref:alpha/beta fold hydrolase n=1 Tax=uncultured Flavobacterium sp. TaxID=165435 RepID=UPI0025E1EAEA|nr:alpha/beta hydrolase [uncultured Flavobacterium sp.]
MDSKILRHQTAKILGTEIFYRVAGHPGNPAVLLLHGFPSSSAMFKSLMLSLSDRFYLIAPDYPGFGFSAFPGRKEFEYTFANIARHIDGLINQLVINHFAVYLHDYGCPIGLRICLMNPKRIMGLIVQNGNAYEEGLGPQWDETRDYWADPTPEKAKKAAAFLTEKGTKDQYVSGLPQDMQAAIAPELYILDWHIMSQPGRVAMQLALNTDYQDNIKMYPQFHNYFKTYQPPALILWGRYDPFFDIQEAYCYERDLKNSSLHILEGGHMALETNFHAVSDLMGAFLESI